MRRREVVAHVGAAVVVFVSTWRHARAQASSLPVVGYLASRSAEDSANVEPVFHAALAKAGYADGRNIAMEYSWARGEYSRLPELAAELVKRNVAVIVAFGPSAALAAKGASSTIPIVFVSGGDPVATGLVASLGRPGANVTGVSLFNSELGAKRLEILSEIVPAANVVAILVNPQNPDSQVETGEALAAARQMGRQGFIVNASRDQEIESAFLTMKERHAAALLVGVDPFFNERRALIVGLAAKHRIPAVYQFREFAAAGGLLSYGASLSNAYRLAGEYVGKVLAGAKPADLPVVQSARFELVVNLRTAKTLGLTFSPTLLARADEVIE